MTTTKPICSSTHSLLSGIVTENNIIFFVNIFILCLLVLLLVKTSRKAKKIFSKIILIIGLSSLSFFVLIILNIAILIYFDDFTDNPPSYAYHPLNAMIKYRCYKDHLYCPVNEHDVRIVAPDYLKAQLDKAQITYDFNKKTQTYTLIIRNNNYHQNNERAVIFDPRLAKVKNYGYGLDFFDADIVNNCDGTYKITNPPPFHGPWSKIK